MIQRRTVEVWKYAGIGMLGGMAICYLPFLIAFGPGFSGARVLAWTASSSAAMVWVFVYARLAFKRHDEFGREASKFAWYWGGTAGLAASMPLYVFIVLGGLHWIDPSRPVRVDLARAFVMGFGLPVLAQLAGFLAVLMWWRLAKR